MFYANFPSPRGRTLRRCASITTALTLLSVMGTIPGYAATTTTTFAVTATVLSGCLVTATNLIFGNYSSVSATPTDATSTVTATCSLGVSYTIAADAGIGAGATVAARVMTGTIGGGLLNYLMHSDAARTALWGNGTLGTATVGGTAALLPQSYTVYGRIPINQYPAAGLYTDLVTVTLTY